MKAALLGLLLLALVEPDLPQFEGKAMTGRAIAYPVATVIVPVGCSSPSGSRAAAAVDEQLQGLSR